MAETQTEFAGCYTDYLRSLRPKLDAASSVSLDDLKAHLTGFSIDIDAPGSSQREVDPLTSHVLAVAANLLRRGLPTLPSLRVERAVLAGLPQEIVWEEATTRDGSIRFVAGRVGRSEEMQWLAALAQAHVVVDPRCVLAAVHPDGNFDSPEEANLYCEVLPQVLGPGLAQRVQPQRPLSTMVAPDVSHEFHAQRVDFALDLAPVRAVIEIDGQQHAGALQAELDKRRDQVLGAAGWQVFRVAASDLREPRRIQNSLAPLVRCAKAAPLADVMTRLSGRPLWDEPFGLIALRTVMVPFAVARLQAAILAAIEQGLVRLDQAEWRIVVHERDVPCSELAILDLADLLGALFSLCGSRGTLPSVHLLKCSSAPFSATTLPDTGSPSANIHLRVSYPEQIPSGFDADLAIDISTLQVRGLTEPAEDFLAAHLSGSGASIVVRSLHAPSAPVANRVRSGPPRAYQVDGPGTTDLQYLLGTVFRKREFLPGQIDILRRSLSLQPVIGLLPTGAGKSLCYQLSAFLQPGTTLVVDPLRSLMLDQATNLKDDFAIDALDFINSEQTPEDRERITQLMASGAFQLVFIAPERLQIRAFRDQLRLMTATMSVPYVVIDEAHCVSEWGHDFRTAYLNVARIVQAHCCHQGAFPTVIALTGTASYSVLTDVQREIGVDDEESKVLPPTFDRPELKFIVHQCPSRDKRRALLAVLEEIRTRLRASRDFWIPNGDATACGIVFVPHASGEFGDGVRDFLQTQLGIDIGFYSGKPPKSYSRGRATPEQAWNVAKRSVQREFKLNNLPLLVATKAFGMGIDKPNIRYTVHHGIPPSLEAFYQEAGRAGRDRADAYCAIVFSDDNAAQAGAALDPLLSADQLAALPEPPWEQQGDIHRIVWFHQQAFRGPVQERATIWRLLEAHVYPACRSLPLGGSTEVVVPFSADDSKEQREKAIYRLATVGAVADYTLDYRSRQFQVVVRKAEEEDYLASLQAYVARYKTRQETAQVPGRVRARKGRNALEQCLGFLVEFVYEEIEKRRRTAIRQMAEVARDSANSADFREQLLAYLEKSIFTDVLRDLALRINADEWWDVLDKVTDVDTARQLVGGTRRTLESFPDHPGLLLLNIAGKLSLPGASESDSLDALRTPIRSLRLRLQDHQVEFERVSTETLRRLVARFPSIASQLSALFLEEAPSRMLAQLAFSHNPEAARLVLLAELTRKTSALKKKLLQNGDRNGC